MKNMKKILALVVAVLMIVASMSVAFADKTTAHTIKVTTNGNGIHEYSAFQIFTGNLDATGKKLSNVEWGSAITDGGAALIAAIKADTTTLYTAVFTDADLTSAAKIADKLSGLTDNGAVAKAFADAVNTALGNATSTTKASTTATNKQATINVTGDGYYFVKDTGTIADKDTASRFMLQVVGNIAVTAKDTVLTPDKEIVKEDSTEIDPGVKDNDSSIGDVIRYNVTLPVPDTTLYKDHFVLEMTDTLDAGLTYLGNMTITISTDSDPKTLASGTNYTTTVKTDGADFTLPTDSVAAVKTVGGQTIKVLFKDFKKYVEDNNLIGKTITISYDVVLNEKAEFGVNSNDNTVYFKYSNNPNHTYDGDSVPDDDEVVGKTPDSKTKTFSTTLELDKVDGKDNSALAGAEFELTGTSWHNVVVTGEKFEPSTYTAGRGETIEQGTTYYLLKDGSYTTTTKTDLTAAQYADGDATYVKVIMNKVVQETTPVKLTLVTDAAGHIIVEGIEQGTYTLKETKAPTGYNLDTTEYKLVIDWPNPDAENAAAAIKAAGGFSKGAETNAKFEMDTDGAKFHITIVNNSGSQLPSTGGMGTTILYVGGSILVILAAVLLITKRRMSADE